MTSSQEEVEELTALYDSEKSQNQALEEAVAAEKENFNKVETIQICVQHSDFYRTYLAK